MQSSVLSGGAAIRTGWFAILSRAVGAVLFFELISGLAITLGTFHPAIEWGLLLHTVAGLIATMPLAWYFVRHWKDYSGQALSDVLLLGYVAAGALAICIASGLIVTAQAFVGIRTSTWLRYVHLISTLLVLVTTLPHIILPWSRRRKNELARGAGGWLATTAVSAVVGIFLVLGLAFAYSGNKYRNHFPADYTYPFGKDRPFAPSLAHTATNGAYDSRSLAGSETCGSSGCHTQIYNEWKTSAGTKLFAARKR